MKTLFFIIICGVTLALTALTGCRRSGEAAPDYGRRQSQLLLGACEAIDGHDTTTAVDVLDTLARENPSDGFASVAYRQEQKRQIIEEENRLLASTELNRLLELIRDTETRGITSPEILRFGQYKDALDQLRIFVSKMPWETSESLRQNLEMLERHRPLLNQSEAFQTFFAGQEQTLKELVASERQTLLRRAVETMDLSLVTGQMSLRTLQPLMESLDKAAPGNILLICRRVFSEGTETSIRGAWSQCADQDGMNAFDVSAYRAWDGLDDQARRCVLETLSHRQPLTLSGAWLKYQGTPDSGNAEFFLRLLASRRGCLPKQEIVRELMEKHLLSKEQYRAWCWRSPCPGATELVARLHQIAESRVKTNQP